MKKNYHIFFYLFLSLFSPTHTSTGMHNHIELTPILSIGIFIGILTALTCITIAIIVAIKLRSSHQQNTNAGKNSKSRPGNLQIKEKISVPLSQSEELYDEKNPDVIPSNEGECRTFVYSSFPPPFSYMCDNNQ